jgi:hypothetical protein
VPHFHHLLKLHSLSPFWCLWKYWVAFHKVHSVSGKSRRHFMPCFQRSLKLPQPSGHYMYRTAVTICTASLTFSNPTFCPHSCIYVFFVDLRTNSDYFTIQH